MKKYLTDFYISCDLKFQAILSGLNAANSKYPCIWCKAPIQYGPFNTVEKRNYENELKKDFSCTNKAKEARSYSESISILQQLDTEKSEPRNSKIRQPKLEAKGSYEILSDQLLKIF